MNHPPALYLFFDLTVCLYSHNGCKATLFFSRDQPDGRIRHSSQLKLNRSTFSKSNDIGIVLVLIPEKITKTMAPKSRDKLYQVDTIQKDFVFIGKVTGVFDEMLDRTIFFYSEGV